MAYLNITKEDAEKLIGADAMPLLHKLKSTYLYSGLRLHYREKGKDGGFKLYSVFGTDAEVYVLAKQLGKKFTPSRAAVAAGELDTVFAFFGDSSASSLARPQESKAV